MSLFSDHCDWLSALYGSVEIHTSEHQPPGTALTPPFPARYVVMHPRDLLFLRVELSLYKYAKKQAMRERIGSTWRRGKKLPTWQELESWAGRLA